MENILEGKNIVKRFKNFVAIKNVSFSLEKGKVYGLLGPNGAGKTTLMKMMCNLLKKDGGSFSYDDSLKIRYLMDVPMFYEYLTVEEYLLFLASLNNKGIERVNELLEIAKLKEHKDKKIKELSRGLRQKLGIAAVLIDDTDLLILDEPVSALDPIGRKEILELIGTLKGKMTVVFSSHILEDIEKVCDHILLINNGKIIVDDTTDHALGTTNTLLVKCDSREQILKLKESYPDSKFYIKEANTLEIEYDDLIATQLEILKIAKKANLEISKMVVKRQSLEELFIDEVNRHE